MMFCGNCGAQIEEGVKFCGSCGRPAQAGGGGPVRTKRVWPTASSPPEERAAKVRRKAA